MTGINIQTPWSSMLINGIKTVETRTYRLPEKYIGEELAVIETPGKNGQFKSRIIGTITFSHSFQYPDETSWQKDFFKHKVQGNDKNYGWKPDKEKHGWVVSKVTKFDKPLDIRKRKGIIFTSGIQL